jgi:hypothetical protein
MTAQGLAAGATRGAAAGLVGTIGHTAFQVLVEMPLTGRGESDAPARLAERVLRLGRTTPKMRRRRNWIAHVAVGVGYGVGHGVGEHLGLRGARAVAIVFAAQYSADVVLNTALGLYRPATWSRQDWLVDVVGKGALGVVTGVAYERLPLPVWALPIERASARSELRMRAARRPLPHPGREAVKERTCSARTSVPSIESTGLTPV